MLAPAKVNLTLAVTGRRPDGFHELVSLVAPLALADTVRVIPADTDSLTCSDPTLPTGPENLVWKAVQAFRLNTGWSQPVHLELVKNIPHGAGLGGGSSDAASVLLLLNRLSGKELGLEKLSPIAASVGSDCPLFLHQKPGVMRGRGERFNPFDDAAARRLGGTRVLLFKPSFPVSTPWAYQALAARAPASYADPQGAGDRLAQWLGGAISLGVLLQNSLQPIVFQKYPALDLLCRELSESFGWPTLMSGSGSCCFALPPADADTGPAMELVRERWGDTAWVCETSLL